MRARTQAAGQNRRASASSSGVYKADSPAPQQSVDATGGNDPFALLTSNGCNAIEIRVVMQDHKTRIFSCRRNQQVRHFSAVLTSTGKHALDLSSPLDMVCLGLNQAQRFQSLLEGVPFPRVAG